MRCHFGLCTCLLLGLGTLSVLRPPCSWPKTLAEVLSKQIHRGHVVFPLSFSISCLAVQSCFASLQKSHSATGDPAAREQVYCACRCWQHKQEKGTDAFESPFLKYK